MIEIYQGYDKEYPDLTIDILDYFDISNEDNPLDHSVLKFCEKKGLRKDHSLIYHPHIIDMICKKLCEANILEQIHYDNNTVFLNNYLFTKSDKKFYTQNRKQLKHYLNSLVYGFEYIYDLYKNLVIPLICVDYKDDETLGTGFFFNDGIVTAKHCITDVKHMRIKGYSSEELNKMKIYISSTDGVDIAFIHTKRESNICVFTEFGKIMDEVLVMGYPKIPAFHSFLTAEKATISSIADARLTPTTGTIAALGDEYLTKTKAMLITAKIRGGNSGGPVINNRGSVVGVACQAPCYKPENGSYDDLGYGIAAPICYLSEIITKKNSVQEIRNDFFQDWKI